METHEEQIQYACGFEAGVEEALNKFQEKFKVFRISEIRRCAGHRQQVEGEPMNPITLEGLTIRRNEINREISTLKKANLS